MQRQDPSMRPPIAALLLAACICVPLRQFGAEAARRPVRKIPKIEIKLSGPKSIRPSESLVLQRFTASLTNRSGEPQLLFVREGYLMNAKWDWTVTDAKGWPVGMELTNYGYCAAVPYSEEAAAEARKIHGKELVVLAPGESREFPIPAGPSDDYSFPKAGTYHLAVTLTYVAPNATFYFDEHGKKQAASGYEQLDLSQLSVDSLEMLQNSFSVQATSSTWDLVLPKARMHRAAVVILQEPR